MAPEARAERTRQRRRARNALALLAVLPFVATSLPAAAASSTGKPAVSKVAGKSKKAASAARTSKKVASAKKGAGSASRHAKASPGPETTQDRDAAAPMVVNASWYGSAHHGQRTASGERFDRDALTAAHRTLPFGTRLKVTSVRTGEQVVVTVNDRGPHSRNRDLDVSEAAAYRLGLVEQGTGRVRIAVLDGAGRDASGWQALPSGLSGINLAAQPTPQPNPWR